jgi:menaquinone-9 beta-reductase
MRRQAPLIIGAGPAGTAAAIALAQGGTRASIIERAHETGDALCGGFLSWRTLTALERLGADALGGHPIHYVRVFAGERQAQARLPACANGVSRHRLDTVMQRVAEGMGVGIERGVTVRSFESGSLLCDGGARTPETLFLATGKHDLRGLARPKAQGDAPLGIRVRIPPAPALQKMIGDTIELHLFDGGYAGLLLQEDGSANFCMALRKSRLAQSGGDPSTLLRELGNSAPALGERLAFMNHAIRSDAIANVPYGWRATDTDQGIFRLGDQAACIPSLAGEGIGIAVASGIAGATAWLAGQSAQTYQSDFAARSRRPVAAARFLWERGETPWSATFGVRALGMFPALAGLAARITRIGD